MTDARREPIPAHEPVEPCLWCGSSEHLQMIVFKLADGEGYQIRCCHCHARGPLSVGGRHVALMRWSRRGGLVERCADPLRSDTGIPTSPVTCEDPRK